MRKTAICLLLLTAAITAQAQLLWRISGKELKRPSYIFGTEHFTPVSFTDSIYGLNEAFDATEQVYGETDEAEMTEPESMAMMETAMMLPDSITFDRLFTEQEMTRINTILRRLFGSDFNDPQIGPALKKYSPQALNTMITAYMGAETHPDYDENNTIDGYWQKRAKAENKPTGGLETTELQINTLLKGKSMERQKQLLMCLIDNFEYYRMQNERLTKIYLAQDLAGIEREMNEKLNNGCDDTPEEEEALIYTRNENWASKMPAIMSQRPTLFVFGAGHLPGRRGVLAMLRDAGYTVEAVERQQ